MTPASAPSPTPADCDSEAPDITLPAPQKQHSGHDSHGIPVANHELLPPLVFSALSVVTRLAEECSDQDCQQLTLAADWLWKRLQTLPKRYEHSLGVFEMSVSLALGWQWSPADLICVAWAALLHDNAKLLPKDVLLSQYQSLTGESLENNKVLLDAPAIWHAVIGAEVARKSFGLQDSCVAEAIRFHSTGRAGMTPVEMLVYASDKLEARTRNPQYIAELMRGLSQPLSEKDLPLLCARLLADSVNFLREKRLTIHPDTIAALNDLKHHLPQSQWPDGFHSAGSRIDQDLVYR